MPQVQNVAQPPPTPNRLYGTRFQDSCKFPFVSYSIASEEAEDTLATPPMEDTGELAEEVEEDDVLEKRKKHVSMYFYWFLLNYKAQQLKTLFSTTPVSIFLEFAYTIALEDEELVSAQGSLDIPTRTELVGEGEVPESPGDEQFDNAASDEGGYIMGNNWIL